MNPFSDADKLESKQSLESTIRKLENAWSGMTQQGVNTTLVKKRLDAIRIGLAMLENSWHASPPVTPHPYTQQDVAEARKVIAGLLPSIENQYAKAKAGSPQRTLLEKRLKSLGRAIQALDECSTS
ncbi:hypothetical protein [Marinicrinis sediminis]|uniref:Uncharacterized protein n=1 Tax=Marinicrinis sediminis TaxID=1652465 RepID=A0ABW5RFU7_9BACL